MNGKRAKALRRLSGVVEFRDNHGGEIRLSLGRWMRGTTMYKDVACMHKIIKVDPEDKNTWYRPIRRRLDTACPRSWYQTLKKECVT